MKDLGVSLSYFDYYQGVLALAFALGSIGFGLIIKKYDHQKKMLYISNQIFVAALIGIALTAFLDNSNPLFITLALLLFVIGQIIPSAILYPLCLNFMPQAKARVSAIIQGARLIFSALSLQLAGYYYQGTFRNIGIILIGFIFLAIVTLLLVIKNRDLVKQMS